MNSAPESAWFKSSYSSDQGASCVEVADLTPTHALAPEAFSALIDDVKESRP